jgi:hypothetical protein
MAPTTLHAPKKSVNTTSVVYCPATIVAALVQSRRSNELPNKLPETEQLPLGAVDGEHANTPVQSRQTAMHAALARKIIDFLPMAGGWVLPRRGSTTHFVRIEA